MPDYMGVERREEQWTYPERTWWQGNSTKFWRSTVVSLFLVFVSIGGFAYIKMDNLSNEVHKDYVTKEDLSNSIARIDTAVSNLGNKMDGCISDVRKDLKGINEYLRDHPINK